MHEDNLNVTNTHSSLTESKEEDYDNGDGENNCCPANVPHFPESFESFLQWKK